MVLAPHSLVFCAGNNYLTAMVYPLPNPCFGAKVVFNAFMSHPCKKIYMYTVILRELRYLAKLFL